MSAVHGVLFDFHDTLVSADQWMAMETRSIAFELLERLGVWDGGPSAEERERVEQAYAQLRTISLETGLEYPAEEIARVALRAIGPRRQVTDTEIVAAVDGLSQSYLPDVAAKAYVPETLGALTRGGYRLGVVSNAAHAPFLSWALERLGLLRLFEHIVVSADVGIRKPRREIFEAGLRAMSIAADETVYVGNDYIKDVMGAKLAGMRAVWMPSPGAVDFGQYSPVKPDAVADRFDALPEIVRRWRAGEAQPAPRGGIRGNDP